MSKLALKESPDFAADPINDALVIYTGYGKSPFPRARGHDLVTEFGPEHGVELKTRILALVDELQQPLAEGEKRSKKSVTERAIEQLAPKHSELDERGAQGAGLDVFVRAAVGRTALCCHSAKRAWHR